MEKHLVGKRTFQGIPGIELTANGRLLATWYGGGRGETHENFVMLACSDDGGKTWTDTEWVIDPPESRVRAFDPTLFRTADGRIYWFWAQVECRDDYEPFDGRGGVWYSVCENPEDPVADYRWSDPVRICDGIMMNKPTVLSNGEWALPVSVWGYPKKHYPEKIGAKIVISEDQGKTFYERGKIILPDGLAHIDEHFFYELKDAKTLVLQVRTCKGYYYAVSNDVGKSWSNLTPSSFVTSSTRAFARRLASGRLLVIYNEDPSIHRNFTVALSDDDGRTWQHKILIDPRHDTSYPDMVQAADGAIYIIHDCARYQGGYILISRLTARFTPIRQKRILPRALILSTVKRRLPLLPREQLRTF